MSDYIKRSDAVSALRTIARMAESMKKSMEKSIVDVADTLDELAMSAEVVERKRGEWLEDAIFCDEDGNEMYAAFCSECGEAFYLETNYCPNCGADMRKEQDK